MGSGWRGTEEGTGEWAQWWWWWWWATVYPSLSHLSLRSLVLLFSLRPKEGKGPRSSVPEKTKLAPLLPSPLSLSNVTAQRGRGGRGQDDDYPMTNWAIWATATDQ